MALLKAMHLAPAGSIPDLIGRVERLAGAAPAVAGAPGGRSSPNTFRA
jgi:DNA polymerase-3 subunit gamma/tau